MFRVMFGALMQLMVLAATDVLVLIGFDAFLATRCNVSKCRSCVPHRDVLYRL